MPVRRVRRHFSQLSEFKRGLTISMKTAIWSMSRLAGLIDRSERVVRQFWELWIREGTHVRRTVSGVTRKTTRRDDRRIVRQALVDPTVTRSMIKADVGVAVDTKAISRCLSEENLKSKQPFRSLLSGPVHRKLLLHSCQIRAMWSTTDFQLSSKAGAMIFTWRLF